MERDKKTMFDDGSFDTNIIDENYKMAYRRVKKIKGFYIHLLVYVLVNTFIILKRLYLKGAADFWEFHTFSMALFWGIGIVAHGTSVFGKELFFGTNWEERKIQEFIEKEKENANKWQ